MLNGEARAVTGRDDRPPRALRRDIRLLGQILGNVLRQQGGPDLYRDVEEIRRACKRLRAHHRPDRAAALRRRLGALDLDRASSVVRAFAIYFQLVNIAEQHHRIRRRREHEMHPAAEGPQEESFPWLVPQLRERGLPAKRVQELLDGLRVVLVSTAHPTENVRRTVLEKYQALYAALARLDRGRMTPAERGELERQLEAEVTALWQTDELRSSPPTVLDEVKNNLFYFDDILFDALPEVAEQLEAALGEVYDQGVLRVGDAIRFGTWVGGDRDGNPAVTAQVTRQALLLQKRLVLTKYLRAVASLARKLSASSTLVPPTPALECSMAEDAAAMPEFAAFMRGRNLQEPYRRKLFFMYRKLEIALARAGGEADSPLVGTGATPPPVGTTDQGYRRAAEFLADLGLLERALEETGGTVLARAHVAPLVRRAHLFGFHLTTMDLRAHSSVHEQTVAELLAQAGIASDYASRGPEEQAALLSALLAPGGWEPGRVARGALGPAAAEALAVFDMLSWAQTELGPEAIGPYIISMTHGVEDVLEVLLLGLETGVSGWRESGGYRSTLDVAPLMETIGDLQQAAGMLRSLVRHPAYRTHLAARERRQEVMLGYSDSTKDGGYLAANWALHRAQSEMAAVAAAEGVELTYFHGRGGSLGRGGGPLGRAIRAQPADTLNGRLRITQQGEVMSHRFLPAEIALRTLEQVLVAVLDASSRAPEAPGVEPRWAEAMEEMAARAQARYRALVEAPGFLPYFYACTPIEEIAMLNIGSRPSRRRAGQGLEDLRAIPWVFAWTQSRHLIPGWYGVGTALEGLGDWPLLREMYSSWPFFRTVLDNCAMALAKADMPIAAAYAELAARGVAEAQTIFDQVRREHGRTESAVLRVQGHQRLLDDQPALRRSIELRNPYVDPLSYLQVELLARLRAATEAQERDRYLVAVLRTLNGVAHALRNTG